MARDTGEMGTSKGIHRILVADDEPTVRTLVKEALQKERHFVQVCENGDEVLDRLEKGRYSLFILDVFMPGLNGFKLAELIRARGSAKPIILMSDLEPADTIRMCDAASPITAVKKPFTMKELGAAIRSVAASIRS